MIESTVKPSNGGHIMNDPGLRKCLRMMVYKCDNCGEFNILPHDYSATFVKCKTCDSFLSEGMIWGDSHNPEDHPETAFTIGGMTPSGKPFIQVYFHTECRDCHKMHYIPYKFDTMTKKMRLFYEDCPCHKALVGRPATPAPKAPEEEVDEPVFKSTPIPERAPEPAKPVARAAPKAAKEYAIDVVLDGERAQAMKDCMFDTDMTKNDVVMEALDEYFESRGYLKRGA